MRNVIEAYKRRRLRRLKARFDEEDWVTIKGTHVLVDDDGNVTGGPSNLKGKQYKNAQPSARVKRQSQAQTQAPAKPKRATDCKDIGELQTYLNDKGWSWTSENPKVTKEEYKKYADVKFDQLDPKKMSDGIGAVENFMDEFPDMSGDFAGFRNRASGVACTNGEYIGFSPLYFMKDAERNLDDVIKKNTDNNWWPKNTSVNGILSHEMGHFLMGWLTSNNPEYPNSWDKAEAWNKGTEARKIVSQACRNVKKTQYGKGKKNEELKKGISDQAFDRGDSECFAEAFADCACNGDNASPLSIEIRKLAVARYKELGGKTK